MININDKLKSLRSGDSARRTKTKEVGKISGRKSFTEHLIQQVDEVNRVSLNEELGALRGALDNAGDALERNPSLGNLEVYKALLSNLIAKTTQGAYKVQGVGSGWSPTEKHHVIKLIDEEAAELLQLILNEHKDRMKIAAKLVQIKGLVVDLLS